MTSPYAHYNEQEKMAPLASELVLFRNISAPIFFYLDSPHSGGSLVANFINIFGFSLFGSRYISIAITGIIISLCSFLMLIKLFKVTNNLNLFTLFAFFSLLVFSSPHYMQKSIMVIGNSNLFILIMILSLYFIYKTFFLEKPLKKSNFLILGLILGFGVWSVYTMAFMVLVTGIVLFIHDKKFFMKKRFLFVAGGFIIGFSPWLIYNFLYGFPSIYADANIISLNNAFIIKNFAVRIWALISNAIPYSFHFQSIGFFTHRIFTIANYLLLLFLIFLGFVCNTNKKRIRFDKNMNLYSLILLSLIVFVLFFSALNIINLRITQEPTMNVHYHYYVLPIHYLFLMLVIVSVGYIYKNNTLRPALIVILSLVLIINLVNFTAIIDTKNLNHPFLEERYFQPGLTIQEAGFHYSLDEAVFHKNKEKIMYHPNYENYFFGAADRLTFSNKIDDKFRNFFQSLNNTEKEIVYERYFLICAGALSVDFTKGRCSLAPEKIYQEFFK